MAALLWIFVLVATLQGLCSEGTEESCAGENCKRTDAASNHLKSCHYPPPNLGDYKVDLRVFPPEKLAARLPWMNSGGSWAPAHCRPRQTVAILVPYRERLEDLLIFLPNLHGFLKQQLLNYTIFIIEQLDQKHFNRAALLNVGFVESSRLGEYDCVVLHDVDKFPEDTRNLYMCSDQPTHLISKQRYVDKDYRERPYEDYFGGVTAISSAQFRKVNGFSNVFWGWGSEDDDFLERMKHHGLRTRRVADDVGRYREIWHPFGFVNPRRHEVKKDGRNRFKWDGLTNMNYRLVSTHRKPLYTHFGVELLDEDPYMDK